MTNPAPLACHALERSLGEYESRVHVLRGIDLVVPAAATHAVVGPSGCGKSTLLYVLGLLDTPDAGQVMIDGIDAAGLSDDQRADLRAARIGFVFQFHFLMNEFTAAENVMIPMRRHGQRDEPAMRDRAGHLLDLVGLGDKTDRPAPHLSGGEQQRVAIARALANDPQVILADEPTGNLDTANSERVFALLAEVVKRENKTLLLATHNPAIAAACDQVHKMADGRLSGR